MRNKMSEAETTGVDDGDREIVRVRTLPPGNDAYRAFVERTAEWPRDAFSAPKSRED